MVQSPVIEKTSIRDSTFSQRVAAQVKNLNRCYQCSMCSNGCPVAYAMDYYPNEIIHLVRLGQKERVLQSAAIWLCVSCGACTTRCPNEIDIVHLMDVLRRECLKEGFKRPDETGKISKFHQIFMKEVEKRGRIDEAGLLLNYKLKTGDFLSFKKIREETRLGLEMLRKGKLKWPQRKKHTSDEVRKIFKKVASR